MRAILSRVFSQGRLLGQPLLGPRNEMGTRLHSRKRCRRSALASAADWHASWIAGPMIRKLSSGGYRLYSKKKDPKTGKRRNLGTFATREAAMRHERAVQYFKRH